MRMDTSVKSPEDFIRTLSAFEGKDTEEKNRLLPTSRWTSWQGWTRSGPGGGFGAGLLCRQGPEGRVVVGGQAGWGG